MGNPENPISSPSQPSAIQRRVIVPPLQIQNNLKKIPEYKPPPLGLAPVKIQMGQQINQLRNKGLKTPDIAKAPCWENIAKSAAALRSPGAKIPPASALRPQPFVNKPPPPVPQRRNPPPPPRRLPRESPGSIPVPHRPLIPREKNMQDNFKKPEQKLAQDFENWSKTYSALHAIATQSEDKKMLLEVLEFLKKATPIQRNFFEEVKRANDPTKVADLYNNNLEYRKMLKEGTELHHRLQAKRAYKKFEELSKSQKIDFGRDSLGKPIGAYGAPHIFDVCNKNATRWKAIWNDQPKSIAKLKLANQDLAKIKRAADLATQEAIDLQAIIEAMHRKVTGQTLTDLFSDALQIHNDVKKKFTAEVAILEDKVAELLINLETFKKTKEENENRIKLLKISIKGKPIKNEKSIFYAIKQINSNSHQINILNDELRKLTNESNAAIQIKGEIKNLQTSITLYQRILPSVDKLEKMQSDPKYDNEKRTLGAYLTKHRNDKNEKISKEEKDKVRSEIKKLKEEQKTKVTEKKIFRLQNKAKKWREKYKKAA